MASEPSVANPNLTPQETPERSSPDALPARAALPPWPLSPLWLIRIIASY